MDCIIKLKTLTMSYVYIMNGSTYALTTALASHSLGNIRPRRWVLQPHTDDTLLLITGVHYQRMLAGEHEGTLSGGDRDWWFDGNGSPGGLCCAPRGVFESFLWRHIEVQTYCIHMMLTNDRRCSIYLTRRRSSDHYAHGI